MHKITLHLCFLLLATRLAINVQNSPSQLDFFLLFLILPFSKVHYTHIHTISTCIHICTQILPCYLLTKFIRLCAKKYLTIQFTGQRLCKASKKVKYNQSIYNLEYIQCVYPYRHIIEFKSTVNGTSKSRRKCKESKIPLP